MEKKWIGAHTSASGGVVNAIHHACELEANAMAFFVKNQRQWSAKPLEAEGIEQFKKALIMAKLSPEQVLVHAGYLINLANPEKEKRDKSLESFIDEMERVLQLGLDRINIHPGSHLEGASESQALEWVAECINEAHLRVPKIMVVIENTAGQGSNLGYSFQHLAEIISKVKDQSRIGVCLDTCHAYAAGYDIATPEGYEKTMCDFEEIVGWRFLKGVHLNDAKVSLGSKKDRHESIGKGSLGIDFFKRLMKDRHFNGVPIILETIDENLWKEEIALLRSFEEA